MGESAGRWRRLVEPGALAALAALVLLDARGYPEALPGGGPGPAFFPRVLAALLIGGAAALAVRAFRATPAATPGSPAGRTRLLAAAAAIGAFLLVLPLASRLVCLPLLVGGLMRLSGERAPALLAAVPLGFTLFVELVFVTALGVPLP